MTDAKPTGRAARPRDPKSLDARNARDQWARTLSDQIVENVLFYRNKRQLSNKGLLRRLTELGWVMTENSLAGVLSKKRSAMPISDVLLFALALNVPPVYLLLPIHKRGTVSIAPSGPPVDALEAAYWLAGTGPPPRAQGMLEGDDIDDYLDVAEMLEKLDAYSKQIVKFGARNTVARHWLAAGGIPPTVESELRAANEVLMSLQRQFERDYPDFPLPPLPIELRHLRGSARDELPVLDYIDGPGVAAGEREWARHAAEAAE